MKLPIEKNKNVIIVGDIMLDQFYHGTLEDTSKEDPLAKVLNVVKAQDNLGGAGNVAANIKAMHSNPFLIGVIGKDLNGHRIIEICKQTNLSVDGIFTDTSRCTTTKTRLYEKDQIIRYDQEEVHGISTMIEKEIITHVESLIENRNIHGIILQDYNKGVLTKTLIRQLLEIAKQNDIPTYVDPKKENFFEYIGASIFKPNLREINWALPNIIYNSAAEILLDKLDCLYAVITLSEKGIYLKSSSQETMAPSLAQSIVDVCGAGDTVISVLSLTHLSKCNMKEMALLANLAAANVCQSHGVIPIEYDKLEELYTSHCQDKVKYDIA